MSKYLLSIKSFSFQFKSINLKQNDDNLIKNCFTSLVWLLNTIMHTWSDPTIVVERGYFQYGCKIGKIVSMSSLVYKVHFWSCLCRHVSMFRQLCDDSLNWAITVFWFLILKSNLLCQRYLFSLKSKDVSAKSRFRNTFLIFKHSIENHNGIL